MKISLGAQALALPSPVWIVGSYTADGRPNAMVVAWAGICCTDPPCIAISVQQKRMTHANILCCKAFTINIPSRDHLAEVDFLGMTSGSRVDKFSVSGLTAVKSEIVNAPYIRECTLILECKVLHVFELGLHTQFIGEILDVKADEPVISNKMPCAKKINPLLSSAADRSYYALGECLGPAYSPGASLIK